MPQGRCFKWKFFRSKNNEETAQLLLLDTDENSIKKPDIEINTRAFANAFAQMLSDEIYAKGVDWKYEYVRAGRTSLIPIIWNVALAAAKEEAQEGILKENLDDRFMRLYHSTYFPKKSNEEFKKLLSKIQAQEDTSTSESNFAM